MLRQPYIEIPPEELKDQPPPPQELEEEAPPPEPPRRRWYFGSEMAKRIVVILIVAAVAYLLWYAYHVQTTSQVLDGSVRSVETGDRPSAVTAVPADTPASVVASAKQDIATATTPATPVAPAMTPVSAQAADTIAANPANGMVFSGTGKFQVYRQGDITWRVNTDTGQTCILFATMEEWQKPLVYQHGCTNG